MKTWYGITEKKYDDDPEYWKRQNNRVIVYIYETIPSFKVIRISDRFAPGDTYHTVKICRSDRTHTMKKQGHLISISAGCTVKAVGLNDMFKLGTDIGKEIFMEIRKKLPDSLNDDEKDRLALEATVGQAYAAGTLDGKKNAVAGLLEVLKE